MDNFNEWIVKRKKSAVDWLTTAIIWMAGLLVLYFSFGLLAVQNQLMPTVMLLVDAGVIYGMYRLLTAQNVEFEYSVTNGDMDVDKIIARRKRVRLLSVNSKNFEYLAPLTEEHMPAFNDASITKRIDASSNTHAQNTCFAIYYKNSEKVCLVFEPTQGMLDDFARCMPRSYNHTR